jgi:dienelactone hydrolase
MSLSRRIILTDGPDGPFEHMAFVDDATATARPGILLFPNVLGTKEADFQRAERVAALGYAVLVADIYGQGKRTTRADPEAGRYMAEMNADRALLRTRLLAAHATLKSLPEVDPARTAAMGFCFGGKCVLDLARAGADITGGISYHGVYDPPKIPDGVRFVGRLLITHGWDDPIAPPEATIALARELTAMGCDWQIHAYGHTGHAFTDESVNLPEKGLAYNPTADRRSWQATVNFLGELFD